MFFDYNEPRSKRYNGVFDPRAPFQCPGMFTPSSQCTRPVKKAPQNWTRRFDLSSSGIDNSQSKLSLKVVQNEEHDNRSELVITVKHVDRDDDNEGEYESFEYTRKCVIPKQVDLAKLTSRMNDYRKELVVSAPFKEEEPPTEKVSKAPKLQRKPSWRVQAIDDEDAPEDQQSPKLTTTIEKVPAVKPEKLMKKDDSGSDSSLNKLVADDGEVILVEDEPDYPM